MKSYVVIFFVAGFASFASAVSARQKPEKKPDFTKGDRIPARAKHDWNLGTTGARGWIYCDNLVTSDARQIAITKIEKGSPAEGVLVAGDVLLGVGGKAFSYDPRTEVGRALEAAETDEGGGKLTFTRWRSGKSEEVHIKIPVLGSYSPTAPYDCLKSKRILEKGCAALAERMSAPGHGARINEEPITRALNALALLASGNPTYLPLIKNEVQWAADYTDDGFQTWRYGYIIMLLAEYVMATGDQSAMPGLRRLALESANGQSAVGSWGHRFANPDGRLAGYGMMNAPGVPLTISLVLARLAGVKDQEVSTAIERSARLLRFYIGKGAIPYGDHHPWTETHEDNGKCGMAAMLFNLLGEANGAEFFARMSLASHGPERDTGHTGNFFNILWAIPSVALSGSRATGAWMREFGAWYFDLARAWNFSFPHQGPPEPEHDSFEGWDATGAYLLAYAMPLKKIVLTGKQPGIAPQLADSAVESIIADGRNWNNKDRNGFYDKLTDEHLVERLGSWSPVVRERAAMALGRRDGVQVEPLVTMLGSKKVEAQYGACQALIALRGRGAPAVDMLQKALASKDLWLRIKAAEAVSKIGKPAARLVPELLELLAHRDEEGDPRGMQQRYFTFALFDSDGGMLSQSLDGVDRDALYNAVRAGLRNQDGRARGSFGSVYRNLSLDEIRPLFPAILQAIQEPAPSGEMFADSVRVEGLQVLAKYHMEDGLQACVQYTRHQNPWASEERTPELMKILLSYGVHAKKVIPELQKIAHYFEKEEKDFPADLMARKAKCVRDTIRSIEKSKESPKLGKIK